MITRLSYKGDQPTLYLISTPIGNLKDISLRALETLNEIGILFAEDTRNTLKLLSHFEIKKTLKSYHEHNKYEAIAEVLNYLNNGISVGLVTDAGTPGISDPGYELVAKVKETYPVVSIPGASAFLVALVASGLIPQPFTFFGFLDRKSGKRESYLNRYKALDHTLIFYERGDRIQDTLKDFLKVFGNRKLVIAKELTKQFETFYEGNISDILTSDINEKGEFVLLLEGYQKELDSSNPIEQVKEYMQLGYSKKDAIKQVAQELGVTKNEIYQLVVERGGLLDD